MNRSVMAGFFALVLASLACGSAAPVDRQATMRALLNPSLTPNATQTPIIVEVTTTPVFVLITTTPEPTVVQTSTKEVRLCVTATEAVHVRPSPSIESYPITGLTNGVEVVDLGGRSGKWVFVEVGDKRGWVDGKYLAPCK